MAENLDIKVNVDSSSAQRNLASLRGTLGQVKAAFAGLVTVEAARGFSNIADQATNLKNRLTVLTGSQAQANATFKQLVDVANGSRSSLAQVGELYARITQSTQQMGLSQSEALEVTDTINKALISTGVSAQEAAGPLLQLGQALSAGALRGEELNSILEGMPVVARAIADSLNVPIGALKKLGEQGAISSKDVIQALKNVRGEVLVGFGRTNVTIGQSFTVLRNSIVEAFGSMDEAAGVSKKVADAILSIADNIQQFARDAEAVRNVINFFKELFKWLLVIAPFFAGGFIRKGLLKLYEGTIVASAGMSSFLRQTFGLKKIPDFLNQISNKMKSAFGSKKQVEALSSKIKEYEEKLKNLNTRTAQGKHQAAEFQETIKIMKQQLEGLAPKTEKNYKLIGIFTSAIAGLAINFKDFFDRIWTGVGQLSLFEKGLHSVISTIGFVIGKFVEFIKSVLDMGATIGLFVADIFGLGDAFRSAGAALQYLFAHPEAPKDYAAEIRRVDNALEAAQKNATKNRDAFADAFRLQLDKQIRGFKQINDELIKQATYQRDTIGLSEDALRIEEAQRAALKEQSDQLAKIQEQHDALKQAAKIGGKGSNAAVELAAFERVRLELEERINAEYEKTRFHLVVIAEQTNDLLDKEKKRELAAQALTKELDRQRDAMNAAADVLNSLEKTLEDANFEESLRGLSEFEAGLRRIDQEAARGARDAIAKIMEPFADSETAPDAAVLEQVAEIEAAYRKVAETQRAAMERTKAEQESFSHGWNKAFEDYKASAGNAAQRAGESFNIIVKGMEDALDRFVETGKLNFGDLARSIIADLIKIQLKAQATKIFSSFFGGGGGGGGGGNIFSSIGKVLGFANGGNPPIGRASIVGENGPELIVPRGATSVIPNHAMGGSTNNTYVTYNINAIDSRSFEQRLSENPKLLYGISKEGERQAGAASFR